MAGKDKARKYGNLLSKIIIWSIVGPIALWWVIMTIWAFRAVIFGVIIAAVVFGIAYLILPKDMSDA